MIRDHDRTGWIGASDTRFVMGNWRSRSWQRWFLEKLGYPRPRFQTVEMAAGSAWEHRILDYIGVKARDRQIKRRAILLRVNLDGEDRLTVSEVKTYTGEKFKVSRAYWQQAQVEHYAAKKEVRIVAYRLTEEDLYNYYRQIDPQRLSFHSIEIDREWILTKYIPRLKVLARCIRERRFPYESEIARFNP